MKVRSPTAEEVAKMKDEAGLMSFMYPAQNPELVESLK
jgi:NAD(P) transhydrogenase subunit alpha